MAELHKKKRQRETDRIWELMQLEDDAFHKKKKVEVEATKKRDSNEDSFNPESSKEENKILKETINHLKNEMDRFRTPPLMMCEVREIVNNNAIIKVPNGNQFFVCISDSCTNIRPGDSVLVDQKNLNIIKKFEKVAGFNVEKFVILEKPQLTYENVGGLKKQIEEIKEVVELPLKKP